MIKALLKFVELHEHIPDLALDHAGEVLMDGPAFLDLRNAVKEKQSCGGK